MKKWEGFQWIKWVFLFVESILLTRIFLILMSIAWFFCVFLVKSKVAFKNTIFWCWIWALIYTNHFYNLDLVEFKLYSAPTYISILFSNLGLISQKVSTAYNLGQNCWDKIKKLFFCKKSPLSPKSMLFAKLQAFNNKTLPDSTLM